MDILADMLMAMRLSGGVILDSEFRAPWCVLSHMGPNDCAPFFPVPEHVIAYHYVRSGRLWARVANRDAVEVRAGEIILFPRNDPHHLFNGTEADPIDAHDLVQPGDGGGPAKIRVAGTGETTKIFCGYLGSATPEHALLQSLPPLLKIAVQEGTRGDWMESSLRFAAEELNSDSPAIGRLAELLFSEAVRRYADSLPSDEGGWLAGVRDPAVSRALAFMHSHHSEPIDVERLATEVGLSRSVLAERFTTLIGEPPIRYWTRWRLRAAANMLRDGKASASEAGYEVGFSSEAAFSRAFKREYGLPPSAWRRKHKASAALQPA